MRAVGGAVGFVSFPRVEKMIVTCQFQRLSVDFSGTCPFPSIASRIH